MRRSCSPLKHLLLLLPHWHFDKISPFLFLIHLNIAPAFMPPSLPFQLTTRLRFQGTPEDRGEEHGEREGGARDQDKGMI